MPTGSKFWRIGYRQSNGKANRLTFGPYPEITLARAREKRTEVRRLLRDGIDPARHRDDAKRIAAEKAAHTFESGEILNLRSRMPWEYRRKYIVSY